MNELREFLMTHENWEEILTKPPYSLKVSRDDGYILFKYNQLESDFSLPIVREARGIIFEDIPTYPCVCYPFSKFGNYGESYVPDIDWETASVQTKIDGSLIKVWYHNYWHISTNGTIDAFKANLNDVNYSTFGDLFLSAFNPKVFKEMDPLCTYMFELVSPANRVVIPYEKTKLYFLGRRHNDTGEEFPPEDSVVSCYYEVPPRIYFIDEAISLNSVIKLAEKLPWDKEGYVVCDKNFNRIKVKSPAYVAAHYLVTNHSASLSRLIDIQLAHEEDEFLTYAPEYKDTFASINRNMMIFRMMLSYTWSRYKHLPTVKDVALAMDKDNIAAPYRSYVFSCYRKGSQILPREWTKNWDGEKWEKVWKGVNIL